VTKLGRTLRRLARGSGLAAVLLLLAAAALALAGETLAAVAAAAVAFVAGVPAALSASAKPRPGFVWQGRYAEPWRAERSPGEPIERDSGGPEPGVRDS
jgi:hypothetical protein